MKFKYSKFLAKPSDAFPDLKEVWRPVVPRADFCIFHADIAEVLGLPVKKGKTSPIFGVTKGGGKVYYHNVGLEIGGWKLNSYVGFSYDLRFPLGILGQRGFLRPKYL